VLKAQRTVRDTSRLRAVGEFICADPRRASAAAQLFRDASAAIESDVRGVSMGSVIPDGARIRIDSADMLLTGTVVAFHAAGRTVVHRIRWQRRAGRARGWLITQGDAMRLPDVPVRLDAVIGRVTALRCDDGTWRPLAAPPRAPRRDRALSWIVFAASVVLLELHPPLSRWFLDKLTRAERTHAWTSSLLY
jgi:hypothetical protein